MKVKMLTILVVLLMSFGMTYAADSVSIALYNVTDGAYVTNGSTIMTTDNGGTPILYRVELSLENSTILGGISLGLRFSSDGALKTNWEAQVGGYGPTGYNTGTSSVIIEPGTRLADPTSSGPFDLGGMIVSEFDVDSTTPDEFLIGGASLFHQLNTGAMDNLWSYYFTLANNDGAVDVSFVVDSAKIGPAGDWGFVTLTGSTFRPGFGGAIDVVVHDPLDAGDDNPAIAYVYDLKQNFPNPFNPTTQIDYSLARKGKVSIGVYNILGQKVNTLVDGEVEAGPHTVYWNGDDSRGDAVASGIYFYKMISDEFVQTHKMVLMR